MGKAKFSSKNNGQRGKRQKLLLKGLETEGMSKFSTKSGEKWINLLIEMLEIVGSPNLD